MATFQFDLVSPEKLLFSGEVTQVDVPGSEGDFGVLAGHAPMVTTLRPGILVVYRDGGDDGELRVVVNGGFAEVSPTGLTVLADMAVPQDEFDPTVLDGVIKDTEGDIAKATDGWRRDKLSHKVDQLKALQAELQ
jgi:F-type H+-transporting ATPase subunit epsilon